jgi:hypothetical protein
VPIDLQILMDEDIAEAGHRRQPSGQADRYNLVLREQVEQLFTVSGQVQIHVRDNVIADVQDRLNGQLQVPFSVAVNQRILDERRFIRQAANLLQQGDVLAEFGDPRSDDVPINH